MATNRAPAESASRTSWVAAILREPYTISGDLLFRWLDGEYIRIYSSDDEYWDAIEWLKRAGWLL